MPFMVEVDNAAEVIARGEAVVAFPWQLATVVRASMFLPAAIYDRAATRAGPQR